MTKTCPICGKMAESFDGNIIEDNEVIWDFTYCKVCGRFELSEANDDPKRFNRDHLMSYLVYNGIHKSNDYRYYTTRPKEWCDKWREEFDKGNKEHGRPIHLSPEIVENWYPKTISERVDLILKYIADHTSHMGSFVQYGEDKRLYSVLFVDRYEMSNLGEKIIPEPQVESQFKFIIDYLTKKEYINLSKIGSRLSPHDCISLTVDGYSRVEELERSNSNGREVLIAMKFGDDTIALREAIRKGIMDAGYVPALIDEVPHNGFITPELLSHIRNSKFVVVDLTHQNNGAYFEEGYAMGYGKEVIQLCKDTTKLHFDIAQKNTIIWQTEEDIPERLKKRIVATID